MASKIQVFGEEWFERHQDRLLFFLNEAPFRRMSRKLLRIHPRDCPVGTEITRIGPNRFSYGDSVKQADGGRIWTRTTDFRTHAKFSKRLFFGLHPLWRGMHMWDSLLAERLSPALDLGFNTLTQYPSYPVTNTCDGITGSFDVGFYWNNRTSSPNNAFTSVGLDVPFGGLSTSAMGVGWEWDVDIYSGSSPLYFDRFFGPLFLFDTSALGASASILSATESLVSPAVAPPSNWTFSSGLPAFTIVSSNPASNTLIHVGDIATFGSISFCDVPVSLSAFSGGFASINWLFNAAGRAAISKIGVTKTALRDAVYDIPNVSPTGSGGSNGYLYLTFSSYTGQTYDPKLVVTWSTGSAASGGYEGEISIRPRLASPKNDAVDVLPSISFPPPGIWGMEQSLPPLHQIPFTRCEPVNVYPSPAPLPSLTKWGWDQSLPLPYALARNRPIIVDVLKSISPPSLKAWQFEPALPPQYRKPFPQASPVDTFPLAPRRPWGWEPWPVPAFRIPALRASLVEVLPRVQLPAWGYEQSLPPLHALPPVRSPYLDILPAIMRPLAGWDLYGPAQYRIPHVPPFPVEVLPTFLAGTSGWEAAGALQCRILFPRPTDLPVLPAVFRNIWGWEASLPQPFRFQPSILPQPDIFPYALAGTSGWEEIGSLQHRIPAIVPHLVQALPSLQPPDWGWESALPPSFRSPVGRSFHVEVFSPVPFGAKGFELIGPSQYRNPIAHPMPADILPGLLAGLSGWDQPGLPSSGQAARPLPSMEAIARLLAGTSGWETIGSLPFRPAAFQSPFADTLPGMVVGPSGWEAIGEMPFRTVKLQPPPGDVLLSIPPSLWGWEERFVPIHRAVPVHPFGTDSLPAALAYGDWGWDQQGGLFHPPGQRIVLLDDWWPPSAPPAFRPTGGGYKPWYGWRYPEIYEDDDLRQRLERTIEAIDEELERLASEEEDGQQGTRIIVPELLPPGWQDDGQGGWREDVRDHRQRREEGRRQQQDPFRHVHYNFASDLDFGVRRRIIGILDRAEHRKVDIFGSEAFRTSENALVKGRFVERGTNAWVVRLDARARLEIAREAVAEGFKLLSFDDTSLSFIHRPTFPWKPVLWGAAAGSTIMGAGIFTGWLIWGRNPRK